MEARRSIWRLLQLSRKLTRAWTKALRRERRERGKLERHLKIGLTGFGDKIKREKESFPNSCLEQLNEGKFSKVRNAGGRRDQGKMMIHHLFDMLKFRCLWAKPNAHVKRVWSSGERPAGV